MDGNIRSLREWADDWHRGPWSMSRLPRVIGATVAYIPNWGRFLGTSYTDETGKSSICINRDLIGTDRYNFTVAHEVGHILLQHTGMHPCVQQLHTRSRFEMRAWRAAALLAIPTRSMEALLHGDVFPLDLSREFGVPLPLVDLRYAMLLPERESCITRSMRITQTDKFIRWLNEEGPPPAT